MNNKLYVGNLSYQLTEQELETQFAQFGTVKSVKIITDRDTGRSKGFGFIEMDNEDQANSCVAELNEKDVNGRNIRVSIARPKN